MTISAISRTELLRRRLSGAAGGAVDQGVRPVPRGDVLPPSSAQRRLWMVDQIAPGGVEYLMPVLVRLPGRRGPVVRRALDELAARHEVLRTRYAVRDGEPVQVIDPPGPTPCETVDLRSAAPGALADLVAAAGRRPFDLAREWPLRALLARVGEDEHALLLTVHHIACDGRSEDVLLTELDALLDAFSAGRPSPLPPPPVQYADFAAWQRERLTGAAAAADLAYWRRTLAGLPPLSLPTDRPRAAVRDAAAARTDFTVPAPVVEALTRLGRQHGATPFMVLLAAFQVLLGRYAGQSQLAVGSPVAGRDRPELQDAVGLFVNMLVLRADLTGDPAFGDLLDQVQGTVLDALTHQHTPFERIVEELAPERDASRHPLFQVSFQLQERAAGPATEQVGWAAAKFDLALALAPRADGSLAGALEYATALFDPGTVERMAGHYRTLLAAVAADPDRRVGRLEILTAAERDDIARWSAPRGPYPTAASIPAAFARHAATAAVAAGCGDDRITYPELEARANRLAHRLRALGAGRGTLVAVRLERGLDLVVALLGVLKSGAGYLPLDPGQPPDRLAAIRADAGAALLVGHGPDAVAPDVPAGEWPDTAPEPGTDPDDVAYVIYTSGSTGRPKGVAVTHRNVLRLFASCAEEFRPGPDDVWTLFHSYAFDFSVWELWGALLHGGRVVVVPYATSRSPRDFLDLLAAERVTMLSQTPSAFRGLVDAVAEAGVRPGELALRTVVFGGEALDVADLAPWFARFGDARPRLVNMYGITETTVHVTYREIRAGQDAVRSPIGRPLSDLAVHVLDRGLDPVPVGVPGEVYVGGPGLARGYLHRPGLTADRFGPDPYSDRPGARMYRTGDLARRRPDGELEFLGRADDQVKIRGHRIEPGEVEAAAAAAPGVAACAVVAHTGRLVMYVVPQGSFDEAALRGALAAVLPAYMVPARFVPVDAIPLTGNGKLDRAALPDPGAHRATGSAPRTPVEQVIADTWAETLGVDRVGAEDNFFALGGDSIRAIRVVGALRPRGVDVAVRDLLVHQTVEGLARFHESAAAGGGASGEERRVAPFELLTPAERAGLPDDVVDAYPLAMVQAAMVYQMVSDPEESPYHNITLLPIDDDGPFSLPALRAAAALLSGRHEVLRTSFDLSSPGGPRQLVHRSAELRVGYDDLRGLAPQEARAAVEAFTAETRRTPFDPAVAPMLRFHVHQTADEKWTFSFIECHAILDGWSHHSLITELMADYRALRDGREPAAPARPTVRYADYVALERRALAAGPDAEFWRDRLARFDRVELPAAWAAAPGSGERPYQLVVPFADLEPGLRRLAAAAGASLKSVLFTAHLTVLGTISGSRRFHTGLVGNGRLETAGGETVRGMHLNTLPFAATLTGGTWTEQVRATFAEEVAEWPHRRFPLPEMQRRWGGTTPLVDVAFTYLDFHVLDARRIESGGVVDVSPNEFGLDVWTFPGRVYLSARPDRVGRDAGDRLAGLYRRVLEEMAADPAGDARAELLTDDETARLRGFAAGAAVELPELGVAGLFERQVAATPDAVALRCADGTSLDYAGLNAAANRVAHRLRALGVGPESRVGVLLRRGPDLVAALLGVLKAGGAYVPLEPAHPAARSAALLAGVGAGHLINDTDLACPGVSVLRPDRDDLSGEPATDPEPTALPENLAYIVHTSGSTGTPKGVLIEHRSLANYVTWCLGAYTPLGGSGAPLYSSMAFDLPVTSLFPALLSGQAVTLTADDGTPNLDGLVGALRSGGFGLLKLTPSHLAVLDQSLDADAVRVATGRLVAGGEELTRGMVSTWARYAPDTVVDNEYGPTETTVGCSWHEGTAGGLADGVLPLGRPIANTVMRVLDADLRQVPVGVVGELCIGGVQVARGYAGRPALTAEKFVPDPYAEQPGARLYRSGDLARYRPDGVLEFAGRVDRQVKLRGHRIEPGEVEAALRAVTDVSEVVVRVRTDEAGAGDLAAYLVGTVDLDAVRAALAEVLPAHLVPASFTLLDRLPVTGNGKIDEAALAAVTVAPATAYVPPRTALENVLARAWAAVLGRPRVGVRDRFTDLGGHSLAVMRVILRLREEHGLRLGFRDFYSHGTIEELARALARTDGAHTADAVVWLRRTGTRPPLFCVHPGSAHWFAELAAHLPDDQPVAAFEWPGLSRPCPAPGSIAEIAELNLGELRRVAPHGPYRLLGWCGGSQITTEMVRRLRAEGETVTFLLLDPALDTFDQDNIQVFMTRFRRAEALLAALADAPPEAVPDLQRQAQEVLELVVDDGAVDPPVPGDDFWPSRVRVWRELLQTRVDYRHRACPGPLHLLAGDELVAGQHDVAVGWEFADYARRWRELAPDGLRVTRVPGTHLGVLRAPHVATVAATLTELMDDTERTL